MRRSLKEQYARANSIPFAEHCNFLNPTPVRCIHKNVVDHPTSASGHQLLGPSNPRALPGLQMYAEILIQQMVLRFLSLRLHPRSNH